LDITTNSSGVVTTSNWWLLANTSPDYDPYPGAHYNQWAYNHQWYASQTDAFNASYDAGALAAHTTGEYNGTGRWYINGAFVAGGEAAFINITVNHVNTGVYYNNEGDNKAYSYIAGVSQGVYTGAAYDIQGDNLAHSYVDGDETGLYTGYAIDQSTGKWHNYLNGVDQGLLNGLISNILNDNLMHYYTSGTDNGAANGWFSVGYYAAGVIATSAVQYHVALDDGKTYNYHINHNFYGTDPVSGRFESFNSASPVDGSGTVLAFKN
jgi:hypothetical protein